MTTFGKEWELRESHINAGEAGEIDLLAHHRTEDCWLVVELKRDSARVQTISQILQYMGWFKENRAGKNEKVKGVIISGWPPNKKLTYALSRTPDIHQKIYILNNGKTEFREPELGYKILKFEKQSINEQKRKWKAVSEKS